MTTPHVLDVRATDPFGHEFDSALVVRLADAQFAVLEYHDTSLLVDADELREALEPKREVRAA